MSNKDFYNKWQEDKNFIIDNDRLKEKTYVFSSFPTSNKYGFQTGKFRSSLFSDVIARFLRLDNKNVLYPTIFDSLAVTSFIESRKMNNMLTDEISRMYLNEMLELGIGVNPNKTIDLRDETYLSLLQQAFIDLYDRGYIEYKNTVVYKNPTNGKIYDYSFKLPSYEEHIMKCFNLKLGLVLDKVIDTINSLNIDDEIKSKLIDTFKPLDILECGFNTVEGKKLNIRLESPEFLGGLSYIFLNPDYINVLDYVSIDEWNNVNDFIIRNNLDYVFSGNFAINPLTGLEVPIFISKLYNKDIYLGIPGVDVESRAFALKEEFEIIEILDENSYLINSDFISDLDIDTASRKIIESFVDAGIGELKTIYTKKEIVISQVDVFGALFPFLLDDDKLYSLKGFLPYTFSVQFRPILNDKTDVPGNPISGSMSSLFTRGMAPIISMLYDKMQSNVSIFDKESIDEFNKWGSIACYIVEDSHIYSDLLMPIILNSIIKNECSTVPNLINNVIICGNVLDKDSMEFKRSNNNLLDIEEMFGSFDIDSIRYFTMKENIESDLIFDFDKLERIDKVIKDIKKGVLSKTFVNHNEIKFKFNEFSHNAKKLLLENNVSKYVELVINFTKDIILKERITKDELLIYLVTIYPIFPYLSEEAYSIYFNDKYSIINEGWL